MSHVHQLGSQFVLPEWLLSAIALIFLGGACFYAYRLLRPSVVRAVYGHYDWENEVGHGICLLAMASCLAPAALQVPPMLWVVVLSLSGCWFFVRALTWGRKLPYNKWWYDWAHVGMLFGMVPMFMPLSQSPWLIWLQVAFWAWFAGYYIFELIGDLPERKALYLGSDLSHLLMGIVMVLMTLFPSVMMPHHSHHSNLHGDKPAILQPSQPVLPQGHDHDHHQHKH